jgi:type III secretory pathway lipoprotein EscJ
MAGDLERTLETIDGVVRARVHLSLPDPDPLAAPQGDDARAVAKASVLLEHRGSVPPIGARDVQKLVAGGVAGLTPENVTVVALERRAGPAQGNEPSLAHVGPIAVARASAGVLRVAIGALLGVIALLSVVTLALYLRIGSRARTPLQRPERAAGSGT